MKKTAAADLPWIRKGPPCRRAGRADAKAGPAARPGLYPQKGFSCDEKMFKTAVFISFPLAIRIFFLNSTYYSLEAQNRFFSK